MRAPSVRDLSFLVLVLALFATFVPPVEAGRLFGGNRRCRQRCTPRACCPVRSGCICVKFWHADLGEVQAYYAHEYDECIEELCPYPNEVLVYGNNLPTNQICPDGCTEMRCFRQCASGQPKLDRPRPETFNIYLPGDPDIRLNPWLVKTPRGHRTGIMRHPVDGRPIYVKVFTTRVHSLTVTADVCFGVEVDSISNVQFDVPGTQVGALDYLYKLPDFNGIPCMVIASQ